MADIKYKVTFFSDWHCGSGLSSGAESDNLVIKDIYGLPYIPGRTIKGLLKEAAYDLFEGSERFNEFMESCFGTGSDLNETDSVYSFFYSDACLSENEVEYLKGKPTEISKLYRNIPSTRIDEETGVADENSLRSMQATIPLTLEGEITNISDPIKIHDCLRMVKRLGYKRNRGFGRCIFSVQENKEGGKQ
jgi:hypothetical protein